MMWTASRLIDVFAIPDPHASGLQLSLNEADFDALIKFTRLATHRPKLLADPSLKAAIWRLTLGVVRITNSFPILLLHCKIIA